MTRMRRPVVVGGPTASGKSALALAVARRDNGCVINADALQVYDCFRVLTARPDPEETALVEHALYGHVTCDRRYSVGAWLRELGPVLTRTVERGLRPVVVGGTGLYLSALVEGLAEIPPIPREVRAASEALLANRDIETMLALLARDDPATWRRIDRNNPMRVQRAWEVVMATGRGLADWHGDATPALLPRAACDCYNLSLETEQLNRRIARRLAAMVEQGALDECRRYLAQGLSRDLPAARALGAAQLFDHLDGTITLDEAIAAGTVATRRYAKRQRTWLRQRMADWIPIEGDRDRLVDAVARD